MSVLWVRMQKHAICQRQTNAQRHVHSRRNMLIDAQKGLYILRMSIVAKADPPCADKTLTADAQSRPHWGEFFRGYIRIWVADVCWRPPPLLIKGGLVGLYSRSLVRLRRSSRVWVLFILFEWDTSCDQSTWPVHAAHSMVDKKRQRLMKKCVDTLLGIFVECVYRKQTAKRNSNKLNHTTNTYNEHPNIHNRQRLQTHYL